MKRSDPRTSKPASGGGCRIQYPAPKIPVYRWLYDVSQPIRGRQILMAVSSALAALLGCADALVVKWLVDRGFHGGTPVEIGFALVIFVCAFGARIGLSSGGRMLASKAGQKLMARLRVRLAVKLSAADAVRYEGQPVGDFVLALDEDVDKVAELVTYLLPPMLNRVLTITVLSAVMLALDPVLTCAVLPLIPMFAILRRYFCRPLEQAAEERRFYAAGRLSFLTEWLAGLLQVQMLSAERTFKRRLSAVSHLGVRAAIRQESLEVFYSTTWAALLGAGTISVLGVGSIRVLQRALTVGGYIAFYTYLVRLFDAASGTTDVYWQLKRCAANIRRLMALEGASFESPVPAAESEIDGRVLRLAYDHVHFAYHPDRPVIDDISFQAVAGERVAIVGRSGTGKTTLLRLLVRWGEPSSGVIRLNGTDIQALDLASLRKLVAFVPQAPFFFEGTIAENARLGSPSARREHLEFFAHVTCFDEVVRTSNGGWQRRLGPGGSGLSAGEKKRLALLRSLLQNREVLVMDEITSELDPAVEATVLSRLTDCCASRIVILITHKPSTALWADRVVALREGRVFGVWSRSEFAESLGPGNPTLWEAECPTDAGYTATSGSSRLGAADKLMG